MSQQIEKLPNGLYKVRVHVCVNGERLTKQKSNIKSMAVAKQVALSIEEELTNSKDWDLITFERLLGLYKDSLRYKNMSPNSQNFIERSQNLVLENIGHKKVKDIDTRDIQAFVDKLAITPNSHNKSAMLSRGTIDKYYRMIQAVLNWGVSQNYVEFNRVKRVELPNDEEFFEPTMLDGAAIANMLDFMKIRYYPLYIPTLLSIALSFRRGELLGLRWQDIDFAKGIAKIETNVIQVDNEIIVRNKLKTRSSRRYVVLSDFVISELLQHKAMNEYLDDEMVCSNVFSGFPSPTYISHAFHDVMLRYFNISIRFHDLRHNFNQLAYESDIDAVTRSKIMGHSNANVTNDIYTHFSGAKARAAVEAVSDIITKSNE